MLLLFPPLMLLTEVGIVLSVFKCKSMLLARLLRFDSTRCGRLS